MYQLRQNCTVRRVDSRRKTKMWALVVRLLMQLLRWCIMHYITKPLVEWAVIRPLSEMLLGEIPVDGGVLEDAIEADVEDVAGVSVEMNGTG